MFSTYSRGDFRFEYRSGLKCITCISRSIRSIESSSPWTLSPFRELCDNYLPFVRIYIWFFFFFFYSHTFSFTSQIHRLGTREYDHPKKAKEWLFIISSTSYFSPSVDYRYLLVFTVIIMIIITIITHTSYNIDFSGPGAESPLNYTSYFER